MVAARKRRGANIRVVGTKAEIFGILAAFKGEAFTWQSNEYFYPRIGQPDFYSYYLEDFEYAPQQEPTSSCVRLQAQAR